MNHPAAPEPDGDAPDGPADGGLTWRDLWVETTARLDGDARHARWLCEEASGFSGLEWVTGLDRPAGERAVARLDRMVARRLEGEPLQYVLGHWAFRHLDLFVDRRVLIPRPETEQLVDIALELLSAAPRPWTVADLGTGSGAIALALADELPPGSLTLWATDVSSDALDVARANLAGLGRAGAAVRLAQGSWWSALPAELAGSLDLVVTNPPYIADDDPEVEAIVRRWEPSGALFSGAGGADALREIVGAASIWLRPGGHLVCEIGARQGDVARALASDAGLVDVDIRADLAGHPRVLVAAVAPRPA